MKALFLVISAVIFSLSTKAQIFVDKADIVYEVKTNLKRTLGNSDWAEKIKSTLPQFSVSYFTLSFSNNTSIYQFTKHDETVKIPAYLREGSETNKWYTDLNTGMIQQQKNMFGTKIDIYDSVRNIKWKYTNERREIAGFNCRKAVGIIMDSVYVFAFFTDEIVFPGGPCSINGLPGTILGMTIPRLYTSWIATSVNVNSTTTVAPLKLGKKTFSHKEFEKLLDDRMKEWIDDNDADDRSWLNLTKWNAQL